MNGKETQKKLKNFQKRWNKKCDEIKNNPMPKEECFSVRNRFNDEILDLIMYTPRYEQNEEFQIIINTTRTNVEHALSISYSKWKDKHPGFWENVSKNLKKITFKPFG